MVMTKTEQELFKANPCLFLEKAIKDYVANSPNNRLTAFPGEHIWDEPIVGFADGDDPIFQEYKKINVIGEFHLTPREVMEIHIRATGCGNEKRQSKVSIVSWVLPSTSETRLSLRRESVVPSLRWNHTRWQGQDCNFRLARHVVSLLEGLGYQAVAPELAKYFEAKMLPVPTSNWSQRHIAYAAGLGTFSLSDGFITPKGIAIRAGSVVCDVALTPSPRPYENHLENCLFYRDGSCRRCIERCPAGAITEQGHDKDKCRDFVLKEQKAIFEKLGRGEGYIGHYLCCGLCQTKVPCEAGIPPSKRQRR